MRLKKRILSAFLAASLIFGSAIPSYTAEILDDGTQTGQTSENEDVPGTNDTGEVSDEGADEEEKESTNEIPLFTVSVMESRTGTVLVNESSEAQVAAGETVTLVATPNEGYELSYIYGIDDEDEMVEFEQDGDIYTFVMPQSDVLVDAIFSEVQPTQEPSEQEEDEEEVWLARSIPEIEAMVGVKSDSTGIMTASTGAVTGSITGNFYGAYTASLRVNGSTLAFCTLPWSKIPVGGTANFADYNVTSASNANLQLMGKIMYYGYGGGGNILTGYSAFDQEAITHFALSYVWMINMGNSHGLANPFRDRTSSVNAAGQALVMNFINTVQSKPAVKGSLHLASYYTQSNEQYQDVAYGSFQLEVTYGYLTVAKTSAIPAITDGNSCYSLRGAVYTVYSDSACSKAVASLTTGSNGVAPAVKLETGTYYVKETTAPKGYLIDSTVHKVKVTTSNTQTAPATLSVKDIPGNDPVILLLKKLDAETGETSEKLAGAEYTVNYYDVSSETDIEGRTPKATWVFKTSDNGVIVLDSSYKVGGSELYTGVNGRPVLPLGYITIQETKAPEGYILDDSIYTCCTSESNGVIRTTNLPTEENAINESPKRGDLEFTKVSEKTGRPLYGVPFEIKNTETGESHIIVTDENGYASTSSDHNSHSKNTNRGKNSHDGVWFGELTALDDSKGALPYGTYTVTELESYANYGMDLVEFSVTISENGVVVNAGDVTNLTIDISTKAFSTSTGIKTLPVGENEEITDIVSYTNLTVGRTYKMKASVVDKDTQEVVARGEKEFTPETTAGTVNVPISIDTTKLAGKALVVFEELYQGDSKRQDHTSLADAEQTVYVPEIGTTAIDGNTKDHVGTVAEQTTLVDTVAYKGLQTGQTYTVTGKLIDKETGEPVLVNNKEVTAETTFTPQSNEGSVDVTFTFDTTGLAGKSVVVFEDLYYGNVEVCSHADIEDEGQTVEYPGIGTSAIDSKTKDGQGVTEKEETVIDTVNYKNLIVGAEYTVKGVLMDKETGKAIIADGKEITAETTFTAAQKNGTVELTYTLDTSVLAGKTVVVFEDLYHNGIEVCSHSDIEDEDQSVHYPKVHTIAINKDTDGHIGNVNGEVTITDTVSYNNLIAGKEYTVKGVLMDKETGKALLINGKEITAETSFTADKADGEIALTFTFDASVLDGKTIVVYEDLYHNGVRICTHSDIADEDQSIHYPKLKTAAINDDTKTHVGNVAEQVTIIDTVSYSNLIIGKEYTVKGTLMDKETGDSLKVDGKEITAETTFTAEETSGEIELTYELDASTLAGKTVVVFEELYYDGVEICSHADIEDNDQSIYYPQIGTSAADSKTGDDQGIAAESETLIDTVSYKNLIAGEEYTLKGILMDKETGEALLVDGEIVAAETVFTPEESDGTVDMEFTFNSVAVKGKTTVVYEDLYHNGIKVTTHSDIEDEGQTVIIPEMHTTALDKDTQSHVGKAYEKATIVDTVSYSNLIAGNEYTVKGTLMDKETGKALKVDGREITAETTFTAEETSGEVELTYELDASALAGKTIVVFETLYYNGVEVYVHADIDDDAQSIYYPEIGTTATIGGSKTITARSTVRLTDTVHYTNLIPGKTYTAKGVLMDKTTGGELVINGSKVTAETTFTPEAANGDVDVTFTFDSKDLGGKELVAYEELYFGDVKVTDHKDINDKGQTVKIKKIGRISVKGGIGNGSSLNKTVSTGDTTNATPFIATLAGAAIGMVLLSISRRKTLKNHKNKE